MTIARSSDDVLDLWATGTPTWQITEKTGRSRKQIVNLVGRARRERHDERAVTRRVISPPLVPTVKLVKTMCMKCDRPRDEGVGRRTGTKGWIHRICSR